jgi:hypothetical protein
MPATFAIFTALIEVHTRVGWTPVDPVEFVRAQSAEQAAFTVGATCPPGVNCRVRVWQGNDADRNAEPAFTLVTSASEWCSTGVPRQPEPTDTALPPAC